MQFLIGGIDRTGFYIRNSLSIEDEINARTTASFDLVDTAGTFHPEPGQVVQIKDNSLNLVFSGFLEEPEEHRPLGTNILQYKITCVDNQAIADRRFVNESFVNQTAGAIVTNILTTILADEGVIAGNIQTGVTLALAVYPTIHVSQAFDELAEASGFAWWIDKDKKLNFVSRETFAAPFNITGNASAFRNVVYRKVKDQYRNRQYIRAGQDKTNTQTETFKGDGEVRTFTVAFKIAEVPTITLNAGAQTVGIRGVDTGKNWYWAKNEKEISQDNAGVKLTSTDILSVAYVGFFPIMTVANAESEILARKAIEGGTGLHESIESFPNIDDADTALSIAQGKLDRFARISGQLTYQTETAGLQAGQIQNVVLPIHGVNGEFLIDRVTITDFDAKGNLRYDVHAVDGQALGGWTDLFKALLKVGKVTSIRENEVLIKLKSASDTARITETLTIDKAAPESRVGFATVGFSQTG